MSGIEEPPQEQTIQTLAGEMSRSLLRGKFRGEELIKLDQDAPTWMTDIYREAHDPEKMPDRWRHRFMVLAVDALAGHEDYDAARESLEPFVYSSDLTGWLDSRNSRIGYLSKALTEYGGFDDGFKLLAAAQMMELKEVFGQVLDGLQKELDGRELAAEAVRAGDQPEASCSRSPSEIANEAGHARHYEDGELRMTDQEHAAYMRDIAASNGLTMKEMDDYYETLAIGSDADAVPKASGPAGTPRFRSPSAIAADARNGGQGQDAGQDRTRDHDREIEP